MSEQTKAVAKTGGKLTFKDWMTGPTMLQRVADVAPKSFKPETMLRVALMAATKTPKLKECSQASLVECLVDLSSMGLSPDGRRAHLIPYGKTCKLIIDYKGLVELVMRSGKISTIHCDLVCESDDFVENLGQVERHVIDRRGKRGNPYAAYSRVVMKDGTVSCEVMGKDEIEAIRDKSPAAKKPDSPWNTFPGEMWKKTVFRRHTKWLPLSPEEQESIAKVDKYDFEDLPSQGFITDMQEAADTVKELPPEPPEDDLPMGDPSQDTPEEIQERTEASEGSQKGLKNVEPGWEPGK